MCDFEQTPAEKRARRLALLLGVSDCFQVQQLGLEYLRFIALLHRLPPKSDVSGDIIVTEYLDVQMHALFYIRQQRKAASGKSLGPTLNTHLSALSLHTHRSYRV